MKGLDYYFDCMLADYLDAPADPEPVPCVYCGADCDDDDNCTDPDCPEQ
jgi:hypothetical protein